MSAQTKYALSGFIGNTHDALIVFEACRRGILPRATGRLSEAERKAIKSGDIYVFNEEESQIKRWTDGKRWSPSRILNNFLIYREIKSDEDIEGEETEEPANGEAVKAESDDVDELAPSTSAGPSTVTERRPSNTPSVTSPIAPPAEASPNPRSVDPKLRNITGGLELLPNRKEGGLIKKTISVAGLHMISYYTSEDVLANRLRQPGSIPEIANIDISHPFLMAQFFRHPPQVTFDADQMPHFAGITDDEPMVRKPSSHQKRKTKEQTDQLASGIAEAALLPGTSNAPFPSVISRDAPFSIGFPSRTSLSPLGPPQNAHHMIPSPKHHTSDQTFSSVVSQMTTDVNPLLPPVRPGTGSRSSTSLSAQSTSDSSSPRIRSTVRHEPYRIPSGRTRYSVTESTPPQVDVSGPSPYTYPRQGSLPNPGMDYYRNQAQQNAVETFAAPAPYSRSVEQYGLQAGRFSDSHAPDYGYTLAGPEHIRQNVTWPTPQQALPPESPRSFYSATSSLQSGQLATGEPPYATSHTSSSSNLYSTAHIPQPDYVHPTLYSGPDFYGRTPINMDHGQSHVRPWYGQASDSYTLPRSTSHVQGGGGLAHAQYSQPPQLLAPQAVQHLSGLLPQTGYSPLLPASAAYASEPMMQNHSQQDNQSHVKPEPRSPGKSSSHEEQQRQQQYEQPQHGGYVTAPPPPCYTHPAQAVSQDVKAHTLDDGSEEAKPFSAPQYPTSGIYGISQSEDPRDS